MKPATFVYYLAMSVNALLVGYHVHLEKKSMDEPIDCRVVMLRSAEAVVFAFLALGLWAILRQDILLLGLFCAALIYQKIYLLGGLILAQIVLWLLVKDYKIVWIKMGAKPKTKQAPAKKAKK